MARMIGIAPAPIWSANISAARTRSGSATGAELDTGNHVGFAPGYTGIGADQCHQQFVTADQGDGWPGGDCGADGTVAEPVHHVGSEGRHDAERQQP